MTHFAHVGAHCAYPGCHQQDFLPFTCVRCQLVFCLDHRREEDHNCKGTAGVSRQVIICPICNLTIQKVPGEDENVTWLRHANTPGLCRPAGAGASAAGGINSRRNSGGSQSPDAGGTNSNNKCVGDGNWEEALDRRGVEVTWMSINANAKAGYVALTCIFGRCEEDHGQVAGL
ncbi:unnamed protein product [Amoebophrya sp. A120]|nr:unnamed protein product [Amoebophrya sp. A120]|eukprot:GSA120T00004471001.1